jgi:hypothetical protein
VEGKYGIGRRFKTRGQKLRIIVGVSALIVALFASISLLIFSLMSPGLADEHPVWWDGQPICMWVGHAHTNECFTQFACAIQENHIHDDDCYEDVYFTCEACENEDVHIDNNDTEPPDNSDEVYDCSGCADSDLPFCDLSCESGNEPDYIASDLPLAYEHDCDDCGVIRTLICHIPEGHVHIAENGCFNVHPFMICGCSWQGCMEEFIPQMFTMFSASVSDRSALTNFITGAEVRDEDGVAIPPGGAIVSGETYSLGLMFGERWNFQLGYNAEGYLVYDFPQGIVVENTYPPNYRTPISGPGGSVQIGEFYIRDNQIFVKFFDVWADGSTAPANFIDVYTNASFSVQVSATFNLDSLSNEFNLGNNITLRLSRAKGTASIIKTASFYDPERLAVDYTLRIRAANGEADIERITDLAQQTVSLGNLWEISGPAFGGTYPEIRNVTVTDPKGLPIPFTLGINAGNPQMFEINFNEPYELQNDEEIIITYSLYMREAINRLYGDYIREYSFSVDNEATVHYNENMRASDKETVRIRHDILDKAARLIHPGVQNETTGVWDPRPRIEWTISVGDGNARLSELPDRTIYDVPGNGVLLPSPLQANVYLYGRTGTYPNYTRGDLIATIPAATLTYTPANAYGSEGFSYVIPNNYGPVYFVVMTFETDVDPNIPVLRWQNTVIFHEVRKVASIATTPGIRLEDWIEIICSERILVTTEFRLGSNRQGSVIYLSNELMLVAPNAFSDIHSYIRLFDYAENIRMESAVADNGANLMGYFRLPPPVLPIPPPGTPVPPNGRTGQFINAANNVVPNANTSYNMNLSNRSNRAMDVLFGDPETRQYYTQGWMGHNTDMLKWPVNVGATIRYTYEVPLSATLINSAGASLGTATLGDFLRNGYKVQSEVKLYQWGGVNVFNQTLTARSNIGWPVTKNHVGTRFGDDGQVYFDYEVIWDGVRRRGQRPHDNPESIFYSVPNTFYYTMMVERFGPGVSACFFDEFDSRLSYVPGSFKVEERELLYSVSDTNNYLTWQTPNPTRNFLMFPQELTWYNNAWVALAPTFRLTPGGTSVSFTYFNRHTIRWNPVTHVQPVEGTPSGGRNTLSGRLNLPANAGKNGPLRFTYTLVLRDYPLDRITLTNTAEIRVHENLSAYGVIENYPTTGARGYVTESSRVITPNAGAICTSASCNHSNSCRFYDSTTHSFGEPVLTKGADHTNNRIHYEIIINPEGAMLRTSGPAITFDGGNGEQPVGNLLIEDIMGENLAFFYDTLRVYLPARNPQTNAIMRDSDGNIIWSSTPMTLTHNPVFNPDDLYSYTRLPFTGLSGGGEFAPTPLPAGKSGIMIVLPNGTPIKLCYDARVLTTTTGNPANAGNDVAILGVARDNVLYMENITSLESWGEGSVENIELFKVDSENRAVRLPGARFGLYVGFPHNPLEPDWVWGYGNIPTFPGAEPTFTADNFTFYFLEEKVTGDGGYANFIDAWLSYYGSPNIVFAMVEFEAPPGYTEAVCVTSITEDRWDSVTFFAMNPHPDIAGQKVRLVFNELTITNEPIKTEDSIEIEGRKFAELSAPWVSRDFWFTIVEVAGLTDTRRMYRIRSGNNVPTDFEQRVPVNWTDAQNGTFTFDLGNGFGPGTYYYMITEDLITGWEENNDVFIAEVTVRGMNSAELLAAGVTSGVVAETKYYEVNFSVNPPSWEEVGEILFYNVPDEPPPVNVILPETGGTGRRVFQIGGLLLMFIAVASIVIIKVRNSSRTRKLQAKDKFEEVEFDKLE